MDNSEYNRNGDYAPTRFASQQDAAKNIAQIKFNQNPESSVGLMAMAGPRPDLKLTPTKEIDLIEVAIARLEISKFTLLTNF